MTIKQQAEKLTSMTDNVSDTVSISTSHVSLVRCAKASSHVIVHVPDVSGALSPWNVRLMVVPLKNIDINKVLRVEFYS